MVCALWQFLLRKRKESLIWANEVNLNESYKISRRMWIMISQPIWQLWRVQLILNEVPLMECVWLGLMEEESLDKKIPFRSITQILSSFRRPRNLLSPVTWLNLFVLLISVGLLWTQWGIRRYPYFMGWSKFFLSQKLYQVCILYLFVLYGWRFWFLAVDDLWANYDFWQ